jgi:hypothetical protein
MRSTLRLLRLLAAFSTFVLTANAEPITYIWTTLAGAGTFGDRSFSSSSITVALYAQTTSVAHSVTGERIVSGQAVVLVQGIGYSVYLGQQTIICSDSAIELRDIFKIATTAYSSYDLKTASPRQSFSPTFATSTGTAIAADVGNIILRNTSNISFEARLGPHDAPTIATDIQSLSVVEGASPKFAPVIQGSSPFSIQWRKNEIPIPGANFSSLTISNAVSADDGEYDVVITNVFGKAQSQKATLTVHPGQPEITLNPLSQGAMLGTTINLNVNAVGTTPISWKWYFKDEIIPGESGLRLTLTNFDESKLGTYYAEASNPLGTTRTAPAILDRSFLVWWGLSPDFIPPKSEEIISLTGGDRHFITLRANGNLDAWGGDSRNQGVVPSGLSNVVSIGAGSAHSLAVKNDGEVTMWGQFFSLLTTVAPEAKFDAAMIAMGVGAQHAVALKKDGTLVDFGTLGTNHTPLIPPANATNIVSVAAGSYHTLALRADGRILAWGLPSAGAATNVPAAATNVIAIAAGWFHNAALRANGSVLVWNGASPLASSNYVDIACGSSFVVGLTTNGQVVCKGSTANNLHIVPAAATNAAAVAAGNNTAFALMGKGIPVFNTVAMDRNVEPGRDAYFRMWAVGAQPIHYQWNVDGVAIPDATNSWLVVTNVQPGVSARYTLTASNSIGGITSKAMGLNLPPIQITNVKSEAGALKINADVIAGEKYRIEYKTNLSAIPWVFVQDLDAQTDTITFSPPQSADSDEPRFYRIRRL